jgi:RimJ/RimL family protein N-acetyltransferase
MKLAFRKTRPGDLGRLNEIVNDPKVCRFLNLVPPVSMKSTRDFYGDSRKNGGMLYSIIVDGRVAGSVCLKPRKNKQAHVADFGISLARECWSEGIGGRAIDFIAGVGRKRGVRRVELEAVAGNKRAIGLYRKHGFRQEGVKKRSFIIDGRYHDTVSMARLSG